MTQDEIIRMAREASPDMTWYAATDDPTQVATEELEFLERFTALVAAHEAEAWKAENKRDYENWKMAAEKAAECEREACAKVCEEGTGEAVQKTTLEILLNERKRIAKAIRDRGDE